MLRDLKWFRSLKAKDFQNGAVRDDIEKVFEAVKFLAQTAEAVDVRLYHRLNGLEALVDKLQEDRDWLDERRSSPIL
jgi:hypothetical protein